jgi:stearoyl-CoA desaturase (delta-9 desaturase)
MNQNQKNGLTNKVQSPETILALFTVYIPGLGVIAAMALAFRYGVSAWQIYLLLIMYLLTGLGVEVGLHRYFSHQSFKAKLPLLYYLGIFGSMAAQGPIFFWVATHRKHHAFTDTVNDPHTPKNHDGSYRGMLRAFVFSHVGWLFSNNIAKWQQYVPDLMKNRHIVRMNQYYFLWLAIGLLIPAVVGWMVEHTLLSAIQGLLWGGLVRICLLDNATWAINSFAHTFGSQPHESGDSSRNLFWLVPLTLGGGWHNNHHKFPALASTKIRPWELDFGGSFVRFMEIVGLASDAKYYSNQEVNKERARGTNNKRSAL